MYPGPQILIALGWLVLMAVGGAIVWLMLTVLAASHRHSLSNQSSEETLRKRLAAGEIDAEEYEKQSQAVSKHKQAA